MRTPRLIKRNTPYVSEGKSKQRKKSKVKLATISGFHDWRKDMIEVTKVRESKISGDEKGC